MKKKYVYIIVVLLAAVTVAVYGQVRTFDFVNFDDNIYITENQHTKAGISPEGISRAFSSKFFNLWIPLVRISFMLDHELYGLNAGGYHLTNLLLHILSTLLLFGLLHRMTGALWKSAFVAAFFALHPLHVESVAWVSERKDVLSAFFWMLTLYLYVYYTEKPAVKRYLLVLCAFALGLMSKPMVVTLPAIMILLDYWPLKRFEARKDNVFLWQLREKALFFVLSAISVIVVLNLPQKILGVFDEFNHQSPEVFPLLSRVKNALIAFVTYLEKTFFPYDLAVFYPIPTYIPTWQAAAASFLIISISAAIILKARRHPYLFVGWFWHAIAIAPVIGIIRIGSHVIADRYTYLPSVGIAIMLAWGIPLLFKNESVRKKVLFPAAVAVLIILSVLTWQQCGYWKDSKTLFSRALQVTENNFIAHNHLAMAFVQKRQFDQAIDHFNEAIRIKSNYYHAYYNRGIAFYTMGETLAALDDFKKTVSLIPDNLKYVTAYFNLAAIYHNLGDYQAAIENYNKAILIKPDYAVAFNNRALVYFHQGNHQMGCADARKACALRYCRALQIARAEGWCR
jgi:tetratricopeptide (TPR) repeat protein